MELPFAGNKVRYAQPLCSRVVANGKAEKSVLSNGA